MACNAIVFQQAAIKEEVIVNRVTLTSDVRKALLAFAKVAFPQASGLSEIDSGIFFYTPGPLSGVAVTVTLKDGVVSANTYPGNADIARLAGERFGAFFRQVGGVQLQADIAKAAGRLARVTNAQPAANGAIILSLEL